MSVFTLIISLILVLNIIAAIFTVLRSVRDIPTTWAWLLVLIFLPVLGFGIYLFAGRGLSAKKVRTIQTEYRRGTKAFVAMQKHANTHDRLLPAAVSTPAARELTTLFLNTASAPVLGDNSVKLFYDGKDKFAQLFADIKQANDHFFVEYYTIYNDQLGTQLRDLLIEKARAGVAVKVLYDAWGSLGAGKRFWAPLIAAGAKVEAYFSSQHLISDFRLNYRLHRKIVVIDDAIGYIGGFNVGDQYVSRKKKFGFWRDTHLRIRGNTVYALKVQFLMDWNATVPDDQAEPYAIDLAPLSPEALATSKIQLGKAPMQIVASGPDSSAQQIKYGYVKMIASATKSVRLQTPYLIPDDTALDALITAALAGIDVQVMVPDMPDHPFIFRATQYYANYLSRFGIKVYHYQNGFLHAKTLVIDDAIASVGSANFDIRSFKLNFEVNAFIYDAKIAQQLSAAFDEDLKHCQFLSPQVIKQQGHWLRFKQYFSRLLSPVL
ncbi:cardiolipin synthase [Lacticaseibacillus jixianensis]|uniref:Cardiolipin synthase n=1 Tax=Lacticaseibacillus jixianensis TaxID=2486012 RepID=A0ABW4B4N5_9LACO|nr:cardiolipin synthase [Lacticaseibacillus jixianensis]